MKKNIFTALLVFTFLLGFWIQWNWKHVEAFPSIISSFYSKEFCSCYYVMKQSEEQCHDFARQWVPISQFTNDIEKKEVSVTGLGRTNKAIFLNEKQGCVLVSE
ncbi:hypothetical protein EHQ58_09480 [Leptospira ognonensis]|uniref:Amidase n=1 Tax=Leptospira ognonensis TaxID=2484945 RepID=A0A4R9K1Z1_9LEPT|nr:hypothetical protein [Leptospira ognonensis]TGL59136.1 hypothetical protein EHQ58_09480 [Leptospira ognonensis]